MTTTKVSEIRKTAPATRVDDYVQPSELCDTQRRSMGYDAFAALRAYGF